MKRRRTLVAVSIVSILANSARVSPRIVGALYSAYLMWWLMATWRASSALPSLQGPVVTEQEMYDVPDGEKEETSAHAECLPGARVDDPSG